MVSEKAARHSCPLVTTVTTAGRNKHTVQAILTCKLSDDVQMEVARTRHSVDSGNLYSLVSVCLKKHGFDGDVFVGAFWDLKQGPLIQMAPALLSQGVELGHTLGHSGQGRPGPWRVSWCRQELVTTMRGSSDTLHWIGLCPRPVAPITFQ